MRLNRIVAVLVVRPRIFALAIGLVCAALGVIADPGLGARHVDDALIRVGHQSYVDLEIREAIPRMLEVHEQNAVASTLGSNKQVVCSSSSMASCGSKGIPVRARRAAIGPLGAGGCRGAAAASAPRLPQC